MSQITASALMADFQRMLDEHWDYRDGAAQEGCVDCSGAFVWAFRQHGKRIYHGSNRIAREEVVALLPTAQARPGMAAFKRRSPEKSGYSLPTTYRTGGARCTGDLNDYYHIGLVDANGCVLNAQGTATGFVSTPLAQWDCAGYLKQVEYEKEETMSQTESITTAIVTAQNGRTVNLRQRPDKSSAILARVPLGTQVTVLETAEGWAHITVCEKTGYMMNEFLTQLDENDAATMSDVLSRVTALEKRVDALEGGVG